MIFIISLFCAFLFFFILFFLLGSEFFVNYTVHFRGKKVSK